MFDEHKRCNICKDEFTTTHVEAAPGVLLYVCSSCLEKANDNFIWICMSCGEIYLRPKRSVINRVKDHELKRAYMLCEDLQIIQGIDMCIACNPELIVEYMADQQAPMEC